MTLEVWSLRAKPQSAWRASGTPRTTIARRASRACLWAPDRRHPTHTPRKRGHDGHHLVPSGASSDRRPAGQPETDCLKNP